MLLFLPTRNGREPPALFINFGQRDKTKGFIGEKAGMDEATIAGLRERVHPGVLPIGKPIAAGTPMLNRM